MKNRNQEFIICAAIHLDDGKHYTDPPANMETGLVICGRRHSNCYAIAEVTLYPNWKANRDQAKIRTLLLNRKCHGFMTSKNRFVNREVGYEIAAAADQLILGDYQKTYPKMLTSEDLY